MVARTTLPASTGSIADDFDLLHGIVRKFGAGKSFLYQYEQIETQIATNIAKLPVWSSPSQQLRQLGDIHGNPPRLLGRE